MRETSDFKADIDAIGRIALVPTILDVICLTTGLRFAAVARVTPDRWIACGVRDGIALGLQPGGELKVETTICNAIQFSRTAVAIDHVAEDAYFSDHPTPRMYGFQSYISVPIILPDGALFGTLCAIDPRPALVNTPQTIGMFMLFAELIAAHLDAHRRLEVSRTLVHHLDREHRQFRQAERMANIGSWRMVLEDGRTEWSDQVFAIHDLPVGATPAPGSMLDIHPPQARDVLSAALARTIETGQPFDVETDLVTAKGRERRLRSMGELEIVEGIPVAIIGAFQDITAQYRLEQSLQHIASIDDLTQIPNRAKCNQVLSDRIDDAKARDAPLALLLIDLDGFKTVNDRCGHMAGDDLLRRVGATLKAPYLGKCFAARLGGDEFVVLVSAPEDCDTLEGIVRQLLSDLRHTIDYAGGLLPVSGTIGIAWLDHTVQDRSDLLHRADMALYAAKQRQRGSAAVFDGREMCYGNPGLPASPRKAGALYPNEAA